MQRSLLSGRLVAALVLVMASSSAWAQDEQARVERILREAERSYALQANPELNIGERALIDFGGLLNFSFLAVDDANQQTRILRQTDVQGYAHLSIDGVHDFYGRLRWRYQDFNAGDSFDGAGDQTIYPLYDRLWYQFNLQKAIAAYDGRNISDQLTIRVGRDFFTWGAGLTFADELYAVDIYAKWAAPKLEFRALVGQTPSSSVIDFDPSRPSFDGDTDRLYVGGMVQYDGMYKHKPYAYVLASFDRNTEDFTTFAGPPTTPTAFDYNPIYFGVGSHGEFFHPHLRYHAEFVLATGNSLSHPQVAFVPTKQSRDRIEAWAARMNLRYLFQDEMESEASFEAVFASGDDDRIADTASTFGGNRHGTPDRAYNALDGVGTGLAFGPPVSNLMMFRAGVGTHPLKSQPLFKRMRIGFDMYVFNKMDSEAPLDEPTGNASFLGIETDLSADWRITSDVSLHMRYGVFFPDAAIETDKDQRHFFYTGVSYAF